MLLVDRSTLPTFSRFISFKVVVLRPAIGVSFDQDFRHQVFRVPSVLPPLQYFFPLKHYCFEELKLELVYCCFVKAVTLITLVIEEDGFLLALL